jgi:hypothetical protein
VREGIPELHIRLSEPKREAFGISRGELQDKIARAIVAVCLTRNHQKREYHCVVLKHYENELFGEQDELQMDQVVTATQVPSAQKLIVAFSRMTSHFATKVTYE